jgi:hypothetical protein
MKAAPPGLVPDDIESSNARERSKTKIFIDERETQAGRFLKASIVYSVKH